MNLKQARKAARLTQKQLAERAGVSEQCVNMLERGKTTARVSTMKLIEDALGQRVTWPGMEEGTGTDTIEGIAKLLRDKPHAIAKLLQALPDNEKIEMLKKLRAALDHLDPETSEEILDAVQSYRRAVFGATSDEKESEEENG